MKIPSSIGHDEATQLIVDCDAAFTSGVAKTNRVGPIKKCNRCGVRFASQSFTYCPICAVNQAKQVDLQNNDKVPKRIPFGQLHASKVKLERNWVDCLLILIACGAAWWLVVYAWRNFL